MKSLAKDLDPDAEANLTSLLSQPSTFPATTGPSRRRQSLAPAPKMNTVIHPDAWRPTTE